MPHAVLHRDILVTKKKRPHTPDTVTFQAPPRLASLAVLAKEGRTCRMTLIVVASSNHRKTSLDTFEHCQALEGALKPLTAVEDA